MDSQQYQRRSGLKCKLFSFNRASKTSSNVQYHGRMKPNYQSSAAVPPITYLVDHQDSKPQPRPKVSFLVPEYQDYRSVNEFDSYLTTVGDENVNMKAASYISSVRERFKLERINSERKVSYDQF